MKRIIKYSSIIIGLLLCTSVFASYLGYRHITQKQYITWRKSTQSFLYSGAMQCANLHYSILLYNDLSAHNYRSARNRFYAMQCSLSNNMNHVKVVKTYAKGRIALITVDASMKTYDGGSIQHPYKHARVTTQYALSNQYVFTYEIHNTKELQNKFIEEK